MNLERDRFLTEQMDERWHELYHRYCFTGCKTCNDQVDSISHEMHESFQDDHKNTDFSTWEGFGKLWEWCIKQDWFLEVLVALNHHEPDDDKGYSDGACLDIGIMYVDPNNFADSVYEYLK